MKYLLLLLLLSGVCQAQDEFEDYVKVTAYRLVEEYDDGPCSIIFYLKDVGIGNFVKAIETDDIRFAKKLISVKKDARKNWKRYYTFCNDGCIGCPTVDKMFIIEANKYRDTLLLMDNRYIYSPGENNMLLDEKGVLSSIFPSSVEEFFKQDFKPEYLRYTTSDSISTNKVLYKQKEIYNYDRRRFEAEFQTPDIITTTIDSLWGRADIEKKYFITDFTLTFYNGYGNLNTLSHTFDLGNWDEEYRDLSVDGITAGDHEDKFLSKFPLSSQSKLYDSPRFTVSELKDNYYYAIKLTGNSGGVKFHIKNRRISKIEIEFDYPSG